MRLYAKASEAGEEAAESCRGYTAGPDGKKTRNLRNGGKLAKKRFPRPLRLDRRKHRGIDNNVHAEALQLGENCLCLDRSEGTEGHHWLVVGHKS